jgi:hypothetical protein
MLARNWKNRKNTLRMASVTERGRGIDRVTGETAANA